MHGAKCFKSQMGMVALLAAVLLTVTGCSALSSDNKESSSPTPQSNKVAPVYHEFDDVLVPGEMKIDRGDSFIYQTAGFTVGILTLKGRVDISSLVVFFEKNMPKDNWQVVSQFKSPRTMMLFQKENRWCVVEISEGNYYTYAKVWVAPTTRQPIGGLVK